MASIPYFERVRTELEAYMGDVIHENPKQMTKILSEYPQLAKLGEFLHNVLQSSEDSPLGKDISLKIEKSFNFILEEFSNNIIKKTEAHVSLQSLRSTNNLLGKIEDETKQKNELREKISFLTEEIEDLNNRYNDKEYECEKLQNKVNSLQLQLLKHKESINNLKNGNEEIKSQSQELTQRIECYDNQIKEYQKNLEISEQNIENTKKEIKKLEENMEKKDNEISELNENIEELKLIVKDKISDNEALQKSFNAKEKKYKETFSKILRCFKEQEKEIRQLNSLRKKSINIIKLECSVCNIAYDAAIKGKNKNNALKQTISNNKEIQENLSSKISDLEQNIEELDRRYDTSNFLINEIRSIFAIKSTDEELPEEIRKVCEKRKEENKKLSGTINYLLRIFYEITDEKKIEYPLLSFKYSLQNAKIVKEELLKDVSKIKNFVETLDKDDDETQLKLLFSRDPNEIVKNCDETNAMFARVCVCLLKMRKKEENQMKGILKTMNATQEKKNESVLHSVEKEVKKLMETIDECNAKLINAFSLNISSKKRVETLCALIAESTKLILHTEKYLRPFSPNSKVVYLPHSISNYISNLKYEVQSSEARSHILNDKCNSKIAKLTKEKEKIVAELEGEKAALQKKLEDTIKKCLVLEIREESLRNKITEMTDDHLLQTQKIDDLTFKLSRIENEHA